MRLVVLALMVIGSSAQEIAIERELVKDPSCSVYAEMQPSRTEIPNIPPICCNHNTVKCNGYGGKCTQKGNSSSCDISINVCNNWYCTCCVSCENDKRPSPCKDNNGVCRKRCYGNEAVSRFMCPRGSRCQCCVKRIDVCTQRRCSNGRGTCVTDKNDCPRGHYLTKSRECGKGNCSCCIPCQCDPKCTRPNFCLGEHHDCPRGYIRDERSCSERQCGCCKPGRPGFPTLVPISEAPMTKC